ncbi:TIGR04255 family protein [Micromonospora sp. NPDC049523]|uniref:TIGR04255 family protein n=1 Tax=Micromonospora sp. NPDC049523 TaxID=3155921 RepID=UPI00342B4984
MAPLTWRPTSPYDDEPLEEVHLGTAPLIRALAQVRHPALRVLANGEEGNEAALKVAARLAKHYPIFEAGQESAILVTPEGVKEAKSESSWIWHLRSPDELWQVSFTRSFIALETSQYQGRTDFLARLTQVLTTYAEEIEPPSYSRVGVRYTNRVSKAEHIGKLAQLVRPELLGLAGTQTPNTARLAQSFGQAQYVTDLGGSTLNWGLLPPNGIFDPTLKPSKDTSWILDIDIFNGKKGPFDATSLSHLVQELATRAYTHFRWAVTEEFLRAFKEA